MKIGIVVNGYWYPPKLDKQVKRLADNLSDRAEVSVIKSTSLVGFVGISGIELSVNLDAAVYLDKDADIAAMLESSGVRLFNRARSIEISDNKMSTHIALASKGIRTPRTISSPLYYRGEDDELFILKVVEKLGLPIVVKECHGSFGAQVYLARTVEEVQEYRAKLLGKPHIYQEFVSSSSGRDTRIIVIGGKVTAAMTRENENDFRSNIELGGTARKITKLDENYSKIAVKSAKALNLDYAGVDVLSGSDGCPIVAEVNSNAYFNAISEVTGVDVAKKYADYILSELNA